MASPALSRKDLLFSLPLAHDRDWRAVSSAQRPTATAYWRPLYALQRRHRGGDVQINRTSIRETWQTLLRKMLSAQCCRVMRVST